MSKDPAVLFYTSDFLTGTVLLNYEQRGKYITLLCLQHQKYLLSEKDMLNICGSYDEDIFSKFVKIDNNFYNQRMRDEHDKRKKYSASRSENRSGTSKNKPKKESNISLTYDNHMENENINSNIYLDYLNKEYFSKFEQMKMKLGTINQEEFLDFFFNKLILEDSPLDFNKIQARFNILFSNWKKDLPKEDRSRHEAPDLDDFRKWEG